MLRHCQKINRLLIKENSYNHLCVTALAHCANLINKILLAEKPVQFNAALSIFDVIVSPKGVNTENYSVTLATVMTKITQYCHFVSFLRFYYFIKRKISKKFVIFSNFFQNHLYKAVSMWYNGIENFGRGFSAQNYRFFTALKNTFAQLNMRSSEETIWKELH